MEKIQVPNNQFFALAKQLLHEGKKIEIPVKGNSMRPFLFSGEMVVVAPVSAACPIRKYDIILAETSTGHIMMHRVREIGPDGILMKGDGNLYQSERISHHDVMGKVVSVFRRGKHVSPYSPILLFLAQVWNPVIVRRVGLFLLRLFTK